MIQLLNEVHNAVQNSRKTVEFLEKKSKYNHWYGNFPVAVIHETTRLNSQEEKEKLQKIDMFNSQGFSKTTYTQEEIHYIATEVPSALKTVDALCTTTPYSATYEFAQKFPHDRWKKVQDKDENFKAFLQSAKFDAEATNREIETVLRDTLRSNKEIPSLKYSGFIWILSVPNTLHVKNILQHYFQDNYVYVEKGKKMHYIAWNEKLADINMRYFVNPPR